MILPSRQWSTLTRNHFLSPSMDHAFGPAPRLTRQPDSLPDQLGEGPALARNATAYAFLGVWSKTPSSP